MTTLEKLGIRPKSRELESGTRPIDGRWRLDGQLGYGAFGKVYRATDIHTGESAALKLFKQNFASSGYLEELGLMFGVTHDHIVEVLSFGYTAGRKYIVYEFVPGGSLRDYLIRYPRLHPDVALDVLRDLAEGLAFAHSHRVVHRDLKPENILLTRPDLPFRCKICDFGLSARRQPGERMASRHGSPAYMAPEQFDGEYDHRVDFFSMGVIFYEMLFGRRPFTGDASSISHAHKHLELPLPRRGPEPIRELLARLLHFGAEDRHVDARQLLSDIERAQSEYARLRDERVFAVPPRPQLELSERWQAMMHGGLDAFARTRGEGLLFHARNHVAMVDTSGRIETIRRDTPVEQFIDGGDPRGAVGWRVGRHLHFVCDGDDLEWSLPDDLTEGAFRCIIAPRGGHLILVRPEAVYCYTIEGEPRWKAEILTYGALPPVAFSDSGLTLWIATEAPRTQLLAMSVEGRKRCRTTAPSADVELAGGAGDAVVVASRSDDALYMYDASGFIVAERSLHEPLMSLEHLDAQTVAAVSVGHIEAFSNEDLEPRGLLEHPHPEEMTVYSSAGLFQCAVLPEGTRLRYSSTSRL